MTESDVEVRVKMTPLQAGKMFVENMRLEKENKQLKGLVADAVGRLQMPPGQIRGEGFRDLMGQLRAVNDDLNQVSGGD